MSFNQTKTRLENQLNKFLVWLFLSFSQVVTKQLITMMPDNKVYQEKVKDTERK